MLNFMIIDWLYDGKGSYDIFFYVVGIMGVISGVMFYFLLLV